MHSLQRASIILGALGLLCACDGAPPNTATEAPPVDLSSVGFAPDRLPDPCDILRTAGAAPLLVRPLESEPMREPGFCLIQVQRGEAFEMQTSAALELSFQPGVAPRDMDEYVVQFGQGLTMAGCTPEDVKTLPELGDFSIWFAHQYPPESTTITLSAFWDDGYLLSLEIHRVDRRVALEWATAVARQVIAGVRGARQPASPDAEA